MRVLKERGRRGEEMGEERGVGGPAGEGRTNTWGTLRSTVPGTTHTVRDTPCMAKRAWPGSRR